MIEFHYETDYQIVDENLYKKWVATIVASESRETGQVNYVFCDDNYLLEINKKYLEHDTYTDIITFDYSIGKSIAGDVFVSIDRVRENAVMYKVDFEEELLRVMAHGILHLCGYGDKEEDEVLTMRIKENEKIKLFHVEQ